MNFNKDIIYYILITTITLILKVWATLDPNSHINFSIWTIQYTRIQGDGKIENQYRTVDKRFQMIAIAWDCNNRRVGEWYGAIPSLANYSGGFHFTSEAYRKFGGFHFTSEAYRKFVTDNDNQGGEYMKMNELHCNKNTGLNKYLNVKEWCWWKKTNNSDCSVTLVSEFSDLCFYMLMLVSPDNNGANIQIYSRYEANDTNICQWIDGENGNQIRTFESESGSNIMNKNQQASCWSSSLSYSCCNSDNDDEWGIQNGDWCYPCCRSSYTVYSTDNYGKWIIEKR
ncbi:hypothetical protein U3516DRAFT_846063 [Neocallimastix sp. 'constans']